MNIIIYKTISPSIKVNSKLKVVQLGNNTFIILYLKSMVFYYLHLTFIKRMGR